MIVGFGENSVDIVYRLPQYPQPRTATAKVMIDRRDVRPGGQVATTLATCARLGLPTRYVGAFGDDDNGRLIRSELERRGVEVQRAVVRSATNRYAVILLDAGDGERVVLWQRDPRLAISPQDVRADWLEHARLLHVDATDEEASIALARLARDRGVPVTCDVDRVTARTVSLLEAVDVPILAEHVPTDLTGENDPERALRLLRRTHAGRIVVTLGPHGSAMLDGSRFIHSPGHQIDVVDSTGAGDVFRGAFICALLRGDGPDEMLRFANAAAAASCTKDGAIDSVPSLEDVGRWLKR
jgi:sulfofructose kinase